MQQAFARQLRHNRTVWALRLACGLIALSGPGCDWFDGDDPPGMFDAVYHFVHHDLGFEPVRPPGSYYAPGTIVSDGKDEAFTVIAKPEDCFFGDYGLSTATTETVLDAHGKSMAAEDAAGTLVGTLLGVKVSIASKEVRKLEAEITSVVRETVTLAEFVKKVRTGGFSDSCRALLKGKKYRVVLEAVRVEGMRLAVTTEEDKKVELDTGNLFKYLHIDGALGESFSNQTAIVPQLPVYLGVITHDLPELPASTVLVLPPMEESASATMAPVEQSLLRCCDRYDRVRCDLQQASRLDALCQCDSMSTIGRVCETTASAAMPDGGMPSEDANEPCAIVSGGPIKGCGANLTEDADPDALFVCYQGKTQQTIQCSTRCHAAPLGMIDFCEDADPCANATRDGLQCGSNLAAEPWAAATRLYECVGNATASSKDCPTECVTGAEGMEDFCL